MTRYVILMGDKEGAYRKVADEAARDASSAIQAFARSTEAPNGATFVAVPARHWKPLRVKTETVTTLKTEAVT